MRYSVEFCFDWVSIKRHFCCCGGCSVLCYVWVNGIFMDIVGFLCTSDLLGMRWFGVIAKVHKDVEYGLGRVQEAVSGCNG